MPKPQHDPLTDVQVRALRSGTIPIDVRDGELRGVILTILPSGLKQFSVRYRFQGKQRRLLLGEYPSVGLKERVSAPAAPSAQSMTVAILPVNVVRPKGSGRTPWMRWPLNISRSTRGSSSGARARMRGFSTLTCFLTGVAARCAT
jgi:hypothetical protein